MDLLPEIDVSGGSNREPPYPCFTDSDDYKSAERGLCSICSRFDWNFLLTPNENVLRARFNSEERTRITGEITSHPGEKRLSGRTTLQKPPFPGEYKILVWEDEDEDPAEPITHFLKLPVISEMIKTSSHCRLCEFIIKIFQDMPPGDLHSISGSDSTKCWVEMYKDQVSISISISDSKPTLICWASKSQSQELIAVKWRTQANLAMLGEFWEECVNNHEECSPSSQLQMLSSLHLDPKLRFRVVDVRAKRVVDAPSNCRYVALSYVWGKVPSIKLTKSGLVEHSLEADQPPSLDCNMNLNSERLLRTIADAIHFVELMGERYLWVDQLCIAQDDRDEVLYTISMMNRIYGASIFTIIADGQDATCGLAGLRPNSRCFDPITTTIDGIRLIRREPELADINGESPLKQSTWNTRGWTYQELYLSTRCFVFIGGRIYYACSKTTRVETEPNSHFRPMISTVIDELSNSIESAYFKHLEHYTVRKLTDPNDILNAFQGILSDLTLRFNIPCYFGVPLDNNSANGLVWAPKERSKTEFRRRSEFPTWSWASFPGSVQWPSGTGNRENCIRFKNDKPTSASDERILEFEAQCLEIDLRKFERHLNFNYWMDNSSPWRRGTQECLLVSADIGHPPHSTYWIVVEQGANGIYYRRGALRASGIVGKELEALLDKEGKRRDIRLG